MPEDNDKPTSWFQVGVAATASWSKWMQSQSFNNVLLVAILVSLGWGTYWTMSEAIPMHIKTIQTGYKEIEANNRDMIKDLDEAHREERREMLNMFDRWFKSDKAAGR
jgi:hypothetical protein